jgi:hypothetical protein
LIIDNGILLSGAESFDMLNPFKESISDLFHLRHHPHHPEKAQANKYP